MSLLVKKVVNFNGAKRFVRLMCSRDGESQWANVIDGLSTLAPKFPVSLTDLPALLSLAPKDEPVPEILKAIAAISKNQCKRVEELLNQSLFECCDSMLVVHLRSAEGIPLSRFSLRAAARHKQMVTVIVHRSTLLYCGRDSRRNGIDFISHFKSRGLQPKGHPYVCFVHLTEQQLQAELEALRVALRSPQKIQSPTTLAKQRKQLEGTIHWASQLRETLQTLIELHGDRVHFRPSSSGVSTIGLLHERPQRGAGALTSLKQITEDFENFFARHCNPKDHGRKTGEKELQSFLIREAYMHRRLMEPINVESRKTTSPVELVFVTDEIALPLQTGKIVCDILAFRRESNGTVIPVLLELKDDRAMTRLIEQVDGYAALIDSHSDLFAQLYSALLGESLRFTKKTEKWIVWPSSGQEIEPREQKYAEKGIRVVCYDQQGSQFSFRVGAAPTISGAL